MAESLNLTYEEATYFSDGSSPLSWNFVVTFHLLT